jgi:DNA invertase Pin-like site-specific DNA recombinase
MPKTVVYLRVSTEEQGESGLGLEAQLAACQACAARQGTPIAAIFQDETSGGLSLDKRPVLLEAITALGRGDSLLVAKRDRLSRGDVIAGAMIEAAVRRRSARVLSAAGEGTDSDEPSAVLMRRMIDAFAEYERLLIGARTKAALKVKAARGERYGQVPYGRRLAADGRRLEVDQTEASAIAAMLELRAAGRSVRAIARELDARGHRTKGGRPWRQSTVHDVLRRVHSHGQA